MEKDQLWLQPFISSLNQLKKLIDITSIPFYEGIISQILEKHLDNFVNQKSNLLKNEINKILQNETLTNLENNIEKINKLQN